MAQDKVIVVLRRLSENNDSVVSLVQKVPDDILFVGSYGPNVMKNERDRVVKDFPEFEDATWTWKAMPLC